VKLTLQLLFSVSVERVNFPVRYC